MPPKKKIKVSSNDKITLKDKIYDVIKNNGIECDPYMIKITKKDLYCHLKDDFGCTSDKTIKNTLTKMIASKELISNNHRSYELINSEKKLEYFNSLKKKMEEEKEEKDTREAKEQMFDAKIQMFESFKEIENNKLGVRWQPYSDDRINVVRVSEICTIQSHTISDLKNDKYFKYPTTETVCVYSGKYLKKGDYCIGYEVDHGSYYEQKWCHIDKCANNYNFKILFDRDFDITKMIGFSELSITDSNEVKNKLQMMIEQGNIPDIPSNTNAYFYNGHSSENRGVSCDGDNISPMKYIIRDYIERERRSDGIFYRPQMFQDCCEEDEWLACYMRVFCSKKFDALLDSELGCSRDFGCEYDEIDNEIQFLHLFTIIGSQLFDQLGFTFSCSAVYSSRLSNLPGSNEEYFLTDIHSITIHTDNGATPMTIEFTELDPNEDLLPYNWNKYSFSCYKDNDPVLDYEQICKLSSKNAYEHLEERRKDNGRLPIRSNLFIAKID